MSYMLESDNSWVEIGDVFSVNYTLPLDDAIAYWDLGSSLTDIVNNLTFNYKYLNVYPTIGDGIPGIFIDGYIATRSPLLALTGDVTIEIICSIHYPTISATGTSILAYEGPSISSSDSNVLYLLGFINYGGQMFHRSEHGSNVNDTVFSGINSGILPDRPVYLAITRSGLNVSFYIDSYLVGSSALGSSPSGGTDPACALYIGRCPTYLSARQQMTAYNVVIHNRALTSGEILQRFNASLKSYYI